MKVVGLARRYLSAGWRHRWKALALAWVLCLLGWGSVYTIPNQFQSSARIYADADVILGTLLRGIAVDSAPASQVDLLQRTLLSRPNMEKVIARTDLDMRVTSTAKREDLLQQLAKAIRIVPQTRNLFTIEYRDPEPHMARDVVQAVLTLFMEQAAGHDRQQMENARTFLAQQIASYESQLREAERRRAEFRARYIDLLPSDALGGATRLEAARSQLQRMRGELQDEQIRRNLTRQQHEATPPTLSAAEVSGGGGGGGDSRLAEAERTLRELRLRFTEQHPAVIAARSAVTELRANPSAARTPATSAAPRASTGSRPNPLREQLNVRLIDSEAQVASLERQVRDAEAEVNRLEAVARGEPELQAQFVNLDRDYNVLRRNYEELLGRRESIQIADAARTTSERVRLEVVDPPQLPILPVGPNRPLLASAVLAGGLVAGAALVVVLVQLNGAFYTVQDLRALGLPVLGGISSSQVQRQGAAIAVFCLGIAMLFVTYGAVLAGVPGMLRRMAA